MNFQDEAAQLINSDFRDLGEAAHKLANHVLKLGGLGFGASFFGFFAAVAAMYVVPFYFICYCNLWVFLNFVIWIV